VTLIRPLGAALRLVKGFWQAIVGEIFQFPVADTQKQIPISLSGIGFTRM